MPVGKLTLEVTTWRSEGNKKLVFDSKSRTHEGEGWSQTPLPELLIIWCTKRWDSVSWRLWSLRSCHASIIKGCCLCFSSFHHCSYIKLCGHSPLQHLRDRPRPSITTRTRQCQQFWERFCWGCHTNCSCNFVCAASIMCAHKMTDEREESQFCSFLLSKFLGFPSEIQKNVHLSILLIPTWTQLHTATCQSC